METSFTSKYIENHFAIAWLQVIELINELKARQLDTVWYEPGNILSIFGSNILITFLCTSEHIKLENNEKLDCFFLNNFKNLFKNL